MEFKITNPFVERLLHNEVMDIKRLHILLDQVLTIICEVFKDDVIQLNADSRGMIFTTPFDEYEMRIAKDTNTMSIVIVFLKAHGNTQVCSTYITLIPEDGTTFLDTKYPLLDKKSKLFDRVYGMNNRILDIDMAGILNYDDTPVVPASEEEVNETGDDNE